MALRRRAMLGAFHGGPIMRSSSLCFILSALACGDAVPAAATPPAPVPACVVTTTPVSNEPPAWLLLAAAVTLLGAGRLAAS